MFKYDRRNDTYTCPAGQTLHTFGTWHTKKREDKISYQYKKYRTPKCKHCPVKHLCTGRAKGGREIERSHYADAVELNNRNSARNQRTYFWNHQTKVGLQLHQPHWTGKSKWRMEFDNAFIQHKAVL